MAALAVLALAPVTAACRGHCAEIAARERALDRTQIAAGPHARVVIPFARANAFLAALVRAPQLRVPLELPALGPFTLPVREITALARRVELRPAPADRLQFAIEVEIDDAEQPVTTLAAVVEVKPGLVRAGDASELIAGFGPDNLVAVRPELGDGSGRALVDAIARWLPAAVRDHVPRAVLDRAAARLAEYLTGQAYDVLRRTLLHRLGDLTQLRVRLPALPIASTAVTSTRDAMTIALTTDLPVRTGLGPAAASDDVVVQISDSTAAELANWSIARGHLPQHYTRSLEPRADGEYRPRLDYLAGDARRPVKIHVFQDRGGCSYFRVGLRFQIAIVDDKLQVDIRDRFVESADASLALEIALWLKQFILGSVDASYRAAAHTRLSIGGHPFVARVLAAAAPGDDLRFTLGWSAPPPANPNGQDRTVRP